MTKSEISQSVIIDETMTFTLYEFCQITGTAEDIIIEMIEYGVIEPVGTTQSSWHFTHSALKRVQTAMRLQRDLEVNLAGSALILDLLDEAETLRKKIALLEHQLFK